MNYNPLLHSDEQDTKINVQLVIRIQDMKKNLLTVISGVILAVLLGLLVFSAYVAFSSGGGGNFKIIRHQWEEKAPQLRDSLGRMITYEKQPIAVHDQRSDK
jgi:hypothetical protein